METNVIMQQNELLWKNYSSIGVLHLPKSLQLDSKANSPFASYKQRIFVWAYPTDCFKVQIAEIDNQSEYLTLRDGIIYSKDMSRLVFCWKEKETFVIPQSVKTVAPFAFCLQTKLRKIELHDGITSIGEAAFMGCKALERITIPPSVTEIKCDTFDGCTSLKEIKLHDAIAKIGSHAFRFCESLDGITLPKKLRSLNSFECCYSLREIDIPATVEEIAGFMFCRNLRKVILHSGVREIRGYAFRYCNNLEEINFPESLETIGARAFFPSNIRKAIFPMSLKEIDTEAFYHNKRLLHIKFQSNVDVKDCAFACCPIIRIKKPKSMILGEKVFVQDTSLDKFGFWD